MTPTVLDAILEGVREDVADRERAVPRAALAQVPVAAPRPVLGAFRAPGASLIAEIKRSSPSKGVLAPIGEPADLARTYERAGATAVSVLTERRRFGGSLADLVAVRAAVDLPLLRKDFVVGEYQVHEGRAAGADLVLLIVAALDDAQLSDLLALTHDLGMEALVEVHDEAELERAVTVASRIIGVNSRNLKTLEVDPGTPARLVPQVPADVVAVSESGIRTPQDVDTAVRAGARAVLVGEALVTAEDPGAAAAALVAAGAPSSHAPTTGGASA
ncbi:indole-3-glycerol phosphate synthase TrpC [Kytococcus sedentarius]|uniref:Indole-3-glycerol phosphate synthase n=1 Tax=Kytococcus sedentarius (strain ATCC 14392 / DSM 20547 / JCM 11482 / CCUG 33030 / NBRC 15357 / NCTC 11040 / CCM 314 / 541) TaxID=478801 RepID=C7NHG3_KYTSD|nr:indole-3-glycerol phosphate synthase TrpC [Kytococcus sedentarius]ACV06320.1 indole-3-glycerol phosphate synthase [Kytococcus sedentarius DSM 20547]QQB64650.1 indole-3-glycerol phosphate synthase TrpC [Kytococcus sedentarius]STX12262.1 Indole-3-glycerol phosphate synthase [Kytococcus sedentarius]